MTTSPSSPLLDSAASISASAAGNKGAVGAPYLIRGGCGWMSGDRVQVPERTGPAVRVQAVRGCRAGQRAVTAWARSNAAELRRLAGQVSTTSGLTDDAQNYADELGHALGSDAPATLLPLFETASAHVRESQPRLAATADHHDR